MPTDLRGCDQVPLTGATFKNPREDLQWEPVDGNTGITDRPDHMQNRREVSFNAIDLHIVEQSVMSCNSIPKFWTLCRSISNKLLDDEFSKVNIISQIHTPSERGVWVQHLSEYVHQLLDIGFATQIRM